MVDSCSCVFIDGCIMLHSIHGRLGVSKDPCHAYLELQKFEAYRFMTRNTSPLSHRSSREEVAAEEEQGKGKAQEVGETGSQVLAARSPHMHIISSCKRIRIIADERPWKQGMRDEFNYPTRRSIFDATAFRAQGMAYSVESFSILPVTHGADKISSESDADFKFSSLVAAHTALCPCARGRYVDGPTLSFSQTASAQIPGTAGIGPGTNGNIMNSSQLTVKCSFTVRKNAIGQRLYGSGYRNLCFEETFRGMIIASAPRSDRESKWATGMTRVSLPQLVFRTVSDVFIPCRAYDWHRSDFGPERPLCTVVNASIKKQQKHVDVKKQRGDHGINFIAPA
ncbi:hypothetical protein BDV98DRAFT_587118 [Pterulicium gracile]|uniref:Uncharacterized protein n=1 Tax=Pterulicium gracile TaxID=1884261 RepID=A0A5C3Q591_9AGAR|nr:hypothetical protein BDV98DRAFT_587118 [Pterula gracilis]